MLRWALVVVGMLALPAHADEVDDLVAKGDALAKQSEYTQAIVAFKQADAKRPRAAHACMIGLAYLRREAWPQAELFLALCEKRAVPGDQPPPWVDAAHQQLASKLRAAQIPAITIEVTPRDAAARLTVSSFAPDEVFDPQTTIHLAPGIHVIELTAAGYRKASRQVSVEAGVPQTVSFTLEREPPAAGVTLPTQVPAQRDVPVHSSGSRVPWIVIGAGAAVFGVGVIYDIDVVQASRDRLAAAETRDAYEALAPDFRSERNVAIGLLAGGAIVAAVGVILKLTVFDSGPQLTARIDREGAAVAIGWQR